jgi:hypothetical protein
MFRGSECCTCSRPRAETVANKQRSFTEVQRTENQREQLCLTNERAGRRECDSALFRA